MGVDKRGKKRKRCTCCDDCEEYEAPIEGNNVSCYFLVKFINSSFHSVFSYHM